MIKYKISVRYLRRLDGEQGFFWNDLVCGLLFFLLFFLFMGGWMISYCILRKREFRLPHLSSYSLLMHNILIHILNTIIDIFHKSSFSSFHSLIPQNK